MEFTKATRKQVKARIAIAGPAGSGKTYSALIAAAVLANGDKPALIDTERESAKLYADIFDFDVLELDTFGPGLYVQAIQEAEKAGYTTLVIDSLSHAWDGVGGALEQKGRMEDQRGMNSWTAWRKITPIHEQLVDAILRCNMHVICTIRSKMQYEQVTEDGKSKVQKVGMAPIQRQGMEYEFTLFCDMDVNHSIIVSKSRAKLMSDKVAQLPGPEFWQPFADWLDSGEEYGPQQKPQPRQENGDPSIENAGAIPYESTSIMPPEQCIEYLRGESAKLKEKYNSQEPTTKQFKLFTGMLSLLAGGDDTCRITWCREVFGIKESTQELKRRNIEAALNYLAPEKGDDGKYHITNDNAQEEFNLIVNAAIQRESVGELPGMEGDDEG